MRCRISVPRRIVLLLGVVLASGCSQKPSEPQTKALDPLLEERRQKDLAFKSGPESPLREEDKARFQSLDYYDINPKLRFKVTLRRYPNPQTLRLATNTEEQRYALRYGYFEFQVDGQICQLQVYRIVDEQPTPEATLFVPFRDETSGRETYGGGRYIDLRENTSGVYDLDFNLAYNPSCAYGKDYSCPVPPRENTLPIPIRAGEKKYRLLEEH